MGYSTNEYRYLYALSDVSCKKYQFLLSNGSGVKRICTENDTITRVIVDEDNEIFEQEEKPFLRGLLIELMSRRGHIATYEDSLLSI